MKKSLNIAAFALATVLTLSSCGGEKKDSKTTEVENTTSTPAETVEVVSENAIQLEGNDQMQFNLTEIKVKAGEEVTLVFKHTGKMDKNIMGHNFVLLKNGTDLSAFAQKAALEKDNDYIPADEKNNVIAHTKTIGGGETTTITFTVADKGTYDFLCTFPAHAALMKGVLIAE